MYTCKKCNKEFSSQRGLNAHQVSHKDGNRYSISRKINKNFFCVNCNRETEWSHSSTNTFCSKECNGEYNRKQTFINITNGIVYGIVTMRKFLLETKGCCEDCGITNTYNNKPITLQCDHIDGNSDNNILENLRLLCPNCHSQTRTWCGRNKKDTKRNNYLRQYKTKL